MRFFNSSYLIKSVTLKYTIRTRVTITSMSLPDEAEKLYPLVQTAAKLYDEGQLPSYDFVGIYILIYITSRRLNNWSNGKFIKPLVDYSSNQYASTKLSQLDFLHPLIQTKYLSKKLGISEDSTEMNNITIICIFNRLQFSNIKKNKDHYINHSIVYWALNERPYQLMFHIPSPLQVLKQQILGTRVITLFCQLSELSTTHIALLQYMDGNQNHEKDAFEFLIHDIKHMENFILNACYLEQIGFFRCMFQLSNGYPRHFFESCGYDEKLWYELEYVISDMNCFSPHLMQYLLAKMTLASVRYISTLHTETTTKIDESTTFYTTLTSRNHLELIWSLLLHQFGMCTCMSSQFIIPTYKKHTYKSKRRQLNNHKNDICMDNMSEEFSHITLNDNDIDKFDDILESDHIITKDSSTNNTQGNTGINLYEYHKLLQNCPYHHSASNQHDNIMISSIVSNSSSSGNNYNDTHQEHTNLAETESHSTDLVTDVHVHRLHMMNSSAYQVAYDMIASSYRERPTMTCNEADSMRQYFRDVASKPLSEISVIRKSNKGPTS